MHWLFPLILSCALFAWVPMVLLVHHRDRAYAARKRPVNEVLAEALAQGRISQERFEEMLDEVHAAMPSLDAPYPLVHDLELLRKRET